MVYGHHPRILATGSLLGEPVRNRLGEDLGTLKDVTIDLETGCIAYAVLSFGGFLGIGDKLFAVPWSALTFDMDNRCFVMDVNKESLRDAPGFDKDNWPDMADETWAREVHTYYGVAPFWESRKL